MDFEADRDKSDEGDPSLAEMTRKAIQILSKNPQGFFLFVEGGRIDHAHHYNNAYRALEETLALEAALEAALPLLDPDRTLIVFTADHSHVMTLGGIATRRGNPIFGVDAKSSDVDGMPYTTLLYGNGPGFGRENLSGVDTGAKNAVQQSAVPRQWATHGGEDVPVYAKGPGSSLFRGSLDQTFLPHAMAYAACIGEHKERCKRKRKGSSLPIPPSATVLPHGQQPSLLPLATGGRQQQAGGGFLGSGGSAVGDPNACDEQSTRTAAVGASTMSDGSRRPPAGGTVSSGGVSSHRVGAIVTLVAVIARILVVARCRTV
ncbi:alkaline phosphatase, tissue-nonspecific isozyme-like [Hetaerina americana]